MRVAINAIPIKPGGALTVLAGLLSGWARFSDQLEITVFVNDPRTEEAVRSFPWVRCLSPEDARGSVLKQFFWQNYRLGQNLAKERADVVVTNNHFLFNLPCPQVVHHHNAWRFVEMRDLDGPKFSLGDRVRDWMARKALRSAAGNVFVSDFLKHQAEKFVPESAPRNVTIRNALDDAVVDAARSVEFDRPRKPQIVVVQSANLHKDNPTVFRTLAELVRREPDVNWQVMLAGSKGRGNDTDLPALAHELGVADRVTWCGFLNHAQLDDLFRESLCLLCTSLLEAGPLPVIEAMARCCVPVAARIPAVEEFVTDAGILVDPHRHDQFAEAIVRLHRDSHMRHTLVERGQQRVQDFRWSDRAERFYNLFNRIGGGKMPQPAALGSRV